MLLELQELKVLQELCSRPMTVHNFQIFMRAMYTPQVFFGTGKPRLCYKLTEYTCLNEDKQVLFGVYVGIIFNCRICSSIVAPQGFFNKPSPASSMFSS